MKCRLFTLRKLPTLLVIVVLVSLATGCSPAVRYYSLQPAAAAARFSADNQGPIVEVRAIGFPEYLNNPQMVTQRTGGQVSLDERNRWVEDLGVNFQRVFVQDLAGRIGSSAVFVSGGSDLTAQHIVAVQVVQFDLDESGSANLSARYTISSAAHPGVGVSSTVVLREAAGLSKDAQVRALSGLVDQLAGRVAGQMPRAAGGLGSDPS